MQNLKQPSAQLARRAGLFFDPGINRVVLFGDDGPTDMWEWDGTSWTARQHSRSSLDGGILDPSVAAFDPARRRLFVFDNSAAWYYDP